jgi:hypothetical protein
MDRLHRRAKRRFNRAPPMVAPSKSQQNKRRRLKMPENAGKMSVKKNA